MNILLIYTVLSSDYNGDGFQKNNDVPFQFIERKYKYEFSIAMNYLHVNYGFLILHFKMYRLNMVTKDDFINHYQKVHCDYQVTFPKK